MQTARGRRQIRAGAETDSRRLTDQKKNTSHRLHKGTEVIREEKRSPERRGGTTASHEKRPVEHAGEFSAPRCTHAGAVVGLFLVPLVPDTRFPIKGSAGAVVN